MTEEQLQLIRNEAEEEAKFAMLFAQPIANGIGSIRSTIESMMRVAFVHGARFGFRLAKDDEP